MGKKSKNGNKRKSKATAAVNKQKKTKAPTITLTEGAIEQLVSVEAVGCFEEQENCKPFTVQVIDIIPKYDDDICGLVLSDGTHCIEAAYCSYEEEEAAAAPVQFHLRRRKIRKNCFIKVNEFFINRTVEYDAVDETIDLVKFEVVGHKNERIGNPKEMKFKPLIDPLGVQRLSSMMSSKDDPTFQPVYQVIEITSVETADSTQYQMDLSDGTHFVSTMSASSQIDDLIKKGDIRQFSLIRIYEFANNLINGNFVLFKARYIDNIHEKIGSPANVYKTINNVKPAGEISSQGEPQKVKPTTADYYIQPITAGAVRRLFFLKLSRDEPNFKPVVQVLSMEKSNESSTYRIEVSDGSHFMKARCGAQLLGLIKNGDIMINSLIRIESFTTVVDELNLDGSEVIMLWTIKKVGQFYHRSSDPVDIEKEILEEKKQFDDMREKSVENQLRIVQALDQAIKEVKGTGEYKRKVLKVGDIVYAPHHGNELYNWGKITSSKMVPTKGMRYHIQFHKGGESPNVPADEVFRGDSFVELIRTGWWYETLPPKDYFEELSQIVENNKSMKRVPVAKEKKEESTPLPTKLKAASTATTTTTTEEHDEVISFKIQYQLEVGMMHLENRKKEKDDNINVRDTEEGKEQVSFFSKSMKTEKSGISFKLLIYPHGNCDYRRNNGWVSFYLLYMDSFPNKQVTTTGFIRQYLYGGEGGRGDSVNSVRDISFQKTFEYAGDYRPQSRLIESKDLLSKCIDKDGNWTVEIHFTRITVTQVKIMEVPPANSNNSYNDALKPSFAKRFDKSPSQKKPKDEVESKETAKKKLESKMKPQDKRAEYSKLESADIMAKWAHIKNAGRNRSSLFKKLLPLANRKQMSLAAKTDIPMKHPPLRTPPQDKGIHQKSPQTITTTRNDGKKFVDGMVARFKKAKARIEEEQQRKQNALTTASADDNTKQEQQEKGAQILYMNLDGKSATLNDVDLLGTIEQVKIKIYHRENVPLHLQSLNFSGKQLENGHTLANYKVQKGSTLHLKLRRGISSST